MTEKRNKRFQIQIQTNELQKKKIIMMRKQLNIDETSQLHSHLIDVIGCIHIYMLFIFSLTANFLGPNNLSNTLQLYMVMIPNTISVGCVKTNGAVIILAAAAAADVLLKTAFADNVKKSCFLID